MCLPHLHLLGRNRPKRLLEVDLAPFPLPKFPRPDEHQRCQAEGISDHRPPTCIGVDRPEKVRHPFGIHDRGPVAQLGRGVGIPKRKRDVFGHTFRDDRVVENLSAGPQRPVTCVDRAPFLDLVQGALEIRRRDLIDGLFPKKGKDVVAKPTFDMLDGNRLEPRPSRLQPFLGDRLKGCFDGYGGLLPFLLMLGRVDPLSQEKAGFVGEVPSPLDFDSINHPSAKGNVGVDSNCQHSFLTLEGVLHPPALPTGGGNDQVEPISVAQLVVLGAGLRVPDLGIGQLHKGVHLLPPG